MSSTGLCSLSSSDPCISIALLMLLMSNTRPLVNSRSAVCDIQNKFQAIKTRNIYSLPSLKSFTSFFFSIPLEASHSKKMKTFHINYHYLDHTNIFTTLPPHSTFLIILYTSNTLLTILYLLFTQIIPPLTLLLPTVHSLICMPSRVMGSSRENRGSNL